MPHPALVPSGVDGDRASIALKSAYHTPLKAG
jgi:hypothetical protein